MNLYPKGTGGHSYSFSALIREVHAVLCTQSVSEIWGLGKTSRRVILPSIYNFSPPGNPTLNYSTPASQSMAQNEKYLLFEFPADHLPTYG